MARFCWRSRCSRCCLSMSCFAVSAISRRTSLTFFSCSRSSWSFFHQRERGRRGQHFLLFFDARCWNERRDPVHLHDRVGDRTDQLMKYLQAVFGVEHLRERAREFEIFAHQRVDARGIRIVLVDDEIRQRPEVHHQVRVVAFLREHAYALDALHDHVCAAFAAFDALDAHQRADVVDAVAIGRVLLRIALGDGQHLRVCVGRRFHGRERLRSADGERHDQLREHHGVLQRKDRKRGTVSVMCACLQRVDDWPIVGASTAEFNAPRRGCRRGAAVSGNQRLQPRGFVRAAVPGCRATGD